MTRLVGILGIRHRWIWLSGLGRTNCLASDAMQGDGLECVVEVTPQKIRSNFFCVKFGGEGN